MNLLGIDLGVHKIAVALFVESKLVHAGAYEVSSAVPRDSQLRELANVAHDWALMYDVDQVWLEDVLIGNNRKYSLQLAEAKGAVISGLAQLRLSQGADIRMVSVQTWKKQVIGSGHASKDEVQKYIRVTYPAYAPVCGDDQDIYDATCVGLYGLLISKRAENLTLSDEPG